MCDYIPVISVFTEPETESLPIDKKGLNKKIMEELTKFVTGQFKNNVMERSFRDVLKTDDGKINLKNSNLDYL